MTALYLLVAVIALAILAAVGVRAIGGNVELVEDWRGAWRFYTTWFFLLLSAMPDLYNAAAAAGLLDAGAASPQLIWAIRTGALVGLMLRMVKQVQAPPRRGKHPKPGSLT